MDDQTPKKDKQPKTLGDEIGYVDLNTEGVTSNLERAKQEFKKFIEETGSMNQIWSANIEGFGKNLTLWTAPISLAQTQSIRAAIEEEQANHLNGLNALGNIPCIVEYQLRETESKFPKKAKRYKKGKWNK
jgi:hypothetical protein